MSIFDEFYLNIKLIRSDAIIPNRGTSEGNAGYDIYSSEDIVIHPDQDILVPTGWCCEFPSGFVMIIKEKSGRRWKNKLHVGAGVIDASYRNEVNVVLKSSGEKPVTIKSGEKIAQFIILPIWTGEPREVDELDTNSDRGGGFGSTGLR